MIQDRRRLITLAAVFAVATALTALGVTRLSAAPVAPAAAPQSGRAPVADAPAQEGDSTICDVEWTRSVSPEVVPFGGTTTVEMKLTASCPPRRQPVHAVLVLDVSGSMANATEVVVEAATDFVDRMDLPNNPHIKIGAVQFNSDAEVLSQLTNDAERLKRGIRRLRAEGCTDVRTGLQRAHQVIRLGRARQPDECTPLIESMILISDGFNQFPGPRGCGLEGCDPTKRTALTVKRDNIYLATVCVNSFWTCDVTCMTEVASSPEMYYPVSHVQDLPATLERILNELPRYGIETLPVEDALTNQVRFVNGSDTPPVKETVSEPEGLRLVWDDIGPITETVTLEWSYEIEPLEIGQIETHRPSEWPFSDTWGCTGRTMIPGAEVFVPTATPQTPATETPAPIPTPTDVVPTPTVVPRPIYLPLIKNEKCVIEQTYTDVVLVLDVSTSMQRLTRDGRTKLAAMQAAAHTFIDLMDLEPDDTGQSDRVGIVSFNHDAWIEQALTRDGGALSAAVDRLPERSAEFTRLDLALERGAEALELDGRSPDDARLPVLVLLTDGIPNRVPTPVAGGGQEDTVLAAAKAAKDAGALIYTIGLGRPEDILGWMLEDAASEPSMYYYAPDGEDLADIYRQIAGRLTTCGP